MLKKDIIIRVGGVYISVLEHCRNIPSFDSNKQKFMMSQFSDFVVCSTNLYILNSGVCS